MDNFYVSLPSNSSFEHYPDNKPGHFYTTLPKNIELSGNYEIGLSEIIFPNSYNNVHSKSLGFKLLFKPVFKSTDDGFIEEETEFFYLEPGLYPTLSSLASSLNNLLRQNRSKTRDTTPIKFYFDITSKRFNLTINTKGIKITITDKLAELIGFSQTEFENPQKASSVSANIHIHTFIVYVYCDLVEHRLVGDVMAPLLRTVPIIDKLTDVTHLIYEKPHYIPLAKRHFNIVEILLATDSGKELHFKSGKCIVTLHIRPKRSYQ